MWSARFQDAGREPEMEDPTLVGHTLYYVSFYYDVERKSPVREIYLQEEGEEARQLFSFGKEDRNHLEGIKVGEDRSLYLLYGEDWVDEECSAYKLEKRNQELQVIYSVDTTAGMGDGFFMYDMEVGGDGYLYGLTIDGSVLYWDEEGVYQGQFSLPVRLRESNGGTFGLANAGDSGIYAYWGGIVEGAGNSIQLYDLGKWRELDETEQKDTMPLLADFKSSEVPVVAETYDILMVYGGYRDGLYLADKNHLWQIDLTDCDWMGINSASQYKEDAWEFIEFCLSYTSRCDNVVDRFVITKSKFGKQTYFEDERSLFKGTGSPGLWDYSNDVHRRLRLPRRRTRISCGR